MFNIGDRIYHRGQNANGVVTGFRGLHTDIPNEYKDYIGVQFMWAKMSPAYHRVILPRRQRGKFVELWTRDEELVLTPKPRQTKNVKMLGKVGFKKRLRAVCEIERQYPGRFEDTDVLYGYGAVYKTHVPHNIKMTNRHVNINKLWQCQQMGDIAPESHGAEELFEPRVDENWILKPYRSYGGLGIESYANATPTRRSRYLQRKVNKVREFRAHVFSWSKTPVPLIQEKRGCDPSQLCWNKKQGSVFTYVYQPHLDRDDLDEWLRKRIQGIAQEACERIGYDSGAVDLALDDQDHLWVFEVNSQPGMREMTLATVKQIIWELGS